MQIAGCAECGMQEVRNAGRTPEARNAGRTSEERRRSGRMPRREKSREKSGECRKNTAQSQRVSDSRVISNNGNIFGY